MKLLFHPYHPPHNPGHMNGGSSVFQKMATLVFNKLYMKKPAATDNENELIDNILRAMLRANLDVTVPFVVKILALKSGYTPAQKGLVTLITLVS